MAGFYIFCFLATLCIFIWLNIADVKRSLSQNLMILLMLIGILGFLSLSVSTNLPEAILSQKINYFGGCFIPILYFLTVCEICHIPVRKRIKIPLLLLQLLIYCTVLTIGYLPIFYKHVEFTIYPFPHMIKEYAFAHTICQVAVYSYYLASIGIAIFSVIQKRIVNHKELFHTIISGGLSVFLFILPKIAGWNIDLVPLSYVVLSFGTISPIYHSNIFTVTENKDIIKEHLNQVGFVTFNRKYEYLGCNDYFLEIFPELKDQKIGNTFDGSKSIMTKLVATIKNFEIENGIRVKSEHTHAKGEVYKIDGKIFDTEIHTINNYLGRCMGYTIEFHDETEHYRILELTNKYNEELSWEVNEKTRKIRTIQEKTILGMAQMVESRDLSTGGHIKRTSDVIRIFAKKLLEANLGFEKHYLDLVTRAAPMHDLGKIGVDDAILRKQAKFTDEEYEMMKTHSAKGAKLVQEILTGAEEDDFVQIATNVAHYHHEKINGFGYPEGLKGEEIPLEARIMALADVFDALVSKRCYKEAFSYDKAFEIIKNDSGSHFDSKLAEVFISCRPELESYYNNCVN